MSFALTFGTVDFRTVLDTMAFLFALAACAFEHLRLVAFAALATEVAAVVTGVAMLALFEFLHELDRWTDVDVAHNLNSGMEQRNPR